MPNNEYIDLNYEEISPQRAINVPLLRKVYAIGDLV
jgi:hypothetical protein